MLCARADLSGSLLEHFFALRKGEVIQGRRVVIRRQKASSMNDKLYVGRPNIGDRQRFLERVNEMFDRRWLSNDGPFLKEFEQEFMFSDGAESRRKPENVEMAA